MASHRRANQVFLLNGHRYLTPNQVGEFLEIEPRTVVRWISRLQKGDATEALQALVWTQDPTNGRAFFREDTVMALKKELDAHRPKRIRK